MGWGGGRESEILKMDRGRQTNTRDAERHSTRDSKRLTHGKGREGVLVHTGIDKKLENCFCPHKVIRHFSDEAGEEEEEEEHEEGAGGGGGREKGRARERKGREKRVGSEGGERGRGEGERGKRKEVD